MSKTKLLTYFLIFNYLLGLVITVGFLIAGPFFFLTNIIIGWYTLLVPIAPLFGIIPLHMFGGFAIPQIFFKFKLLLFYLGSAINFAFQAYVAVNLYRAASTKNWKDRIFKIVAVHHAVFGSYMMILFYSWFFRKLIENGFYEVYEHIRYYFPNLIGLYAPPLNFLMAALIWKFIVRVHSGGNNDENQFT